EGSPALVARAAVHRVLRRAALQRDRQAAAARGARGSRGADDAMNPAARPSSRISPRPKTPLPSLPPAKGGPPPPRVLRASPPPGGRADLRGRSRRRGGLARRDRARGG